ncbi:MAG: hypothetical protein IPP20_21500 [Gemmatimonadetes bacterium]|nr:hypothetical protein [Gemmatimonadota bacterium]
MTFATRDRYRHAVERIAKRSGHRESSVAQWAIDLARAHLGDLAARTSATISSTTACPRSNAWPAIRPR